MAHIYKPMQSDYDIEEIREIDNKIAELNSKRSEYANKNFDNWKINFLNDMTGKWFTPGLSENEIDKSKEFFKIIDAFTYIRLMFSTEYDGYGYAVKILSGNCPRMWCYNTLICVDDEYLKAKIDNIDKSIKSCKLFKEA